MSLLRRTQTHDAAKTRQPPPESHHIPPNSQLDDEDADKFGAADVRIEHGKAADKDEAVYYIDGEGRVYVPRSPEERTLLVVRKIDLYMYTCMSVLYLLN
ncbi:hypothetical protein B0H13DRAFT_2340229 [Mycena leptocephala]|jgi:hypothetical protein|nr:hypothetical protein B0H13DRAFT_2340229 [Mycena leptocephala]